MRLNMNEGAKLGGILTVSNGEDYTENRRVEWLSRLAVYIVHIIQILP